MEYYAPVRSVRTREDESRIINRLPSSRGEFIRLRHLILTDPSLFPRPISDDDVAATLAICSNVISAVLSGIYDLSDRTLYLLAETANNLTGVDLTGCSHITDLGVIELTKHGLPLEWIRLNAAVGINGACITSISKSCPKLLEIELCDLPLLSAPPVRDLWLYSRKLRTVRLSRCPLLTDKAFPMPPVRSGRRTSSANSSVEFNINKPLPPEPLNWIEELPPLYLTHRAENLRVLDLSNCTRLTDRAFDGIVGHAPYIHTLILSACTNLTDRALESISKLGDSLEVLVVPHVTNITDRGIIKLTRSCVRLKAVDLAFCRKLTDMSVLELGGLEGLNKLNIVRLKVTDNAILFLAEHTPSLERLHLSYCDRLTLDAIHIMIKKLTRLQHLSATGVPALKSDFIQRYSDLPPENMTDEQKGAFRVFDGTGLARLRAYLDQELTRKREAEARNIRYVPRE